jgi:hypothetical protein
LTPVPALAQSSPIDDDWVGSFDQSDGEGHFDKSMTLHVTGTNVTDTIWSTPDGGESYAVWQALGSFQNGVLKMTEGNVVDTRGSVSFCPPFTITITLTLSNGVMDGTEAGCAAGPTHYARSAPPASEPSVQPATDDQPSSATTANQSTLDVPYVTELEINPNDPATGCKVSITAGRRRWRR